MLRIRRDDTVMVMAGKDKGKTGKETDVLCRPESLGKKPPPASTQSSRETIS